MEDPVGVVMFLTIFTVIGLVLLLFVVEAFVNEVVENHVDVRNIVFKAANFTHLPRLLDVLPHEKAVQSVLRRLHGRVFVDLGAHYGFYSFILRRNFKHVVAVEPLPSNYAMLVDGVRNFHASNVTCVPRAVSDVSGYSKLFVDGENWNSALGEWKQPGNHIVVETETLDSLLNAYDEVTLVKVDIEGAELKVLRAAPESLRKVGNWVVEIHRAEFKEATEKVLASAGCRCRWLDVNHLYAWKPIGG
jgi:FkbM family methyltransferase